MKPRSLLLRLVLVATVVAPAGGSAAPSLGNRPAAVPRALRTLWFLDRAALARAGIERPARLALDPDGRLHVLDETSGRVVTFDAQGRRLHDLGGYGSGEGALRLPVDLVVDRGQGLLVLDRAPGAILAYDPSGRHLATRPLNDAAGDEARDPDARLLADSFGSLWLLAARGRDLIPLNERLAPARTSRFLAPEESLEVPRAAVFLPSGDVWIHDGAAGALRRFSSSGRLRATVRLAACAGGAAVSDLAADPSGALYAADRDGQRILVLDPDGTVVLERALGGPSAPWRPTALAFGGADRLAVADAERSEIQVLAVDRPGASP